MPLNMKNILTTLLGIKYEYLNNLLGKNMD